MAINSTQNLLCLRIGQRCAQVYHLGQSSPEAHIDGRQVLPFKIVRIGDNALSAPRRRLKSPNAST
jgi:hypothetical protein